MRTMGKITATVGVLAGVVPLSAIAGAAEPATGSRLPQAVRR
jgi:hypothetical protein